MISLNQINLKYGDRNIFNSISFIINKKDRIGLVGNNGAGKSTLLKLILKLHQPDSGKIQIPQDTTFGYLPQQMKLTDNKTIIDEVKEAFSEIINIEKKVERLSHEISLRNDYESDEYSFLLNELNELNSRLDIIGNKQIMEQIEKTLSGLGFLSQDFKRLTSEFSGGWRMRIELAKILLKKPEVLLLDEPTNHLDIDSIQWLEEFLKDYPGAIVLISHDRAFLNTVTKRTIELSLGNLYDYNVSYSKFVELRKERREQQLATFKNQQKYIEETERFIERFRYKNTKAVQVQSRIKQLDKLERIEVDEEDTGTIQLKFPPAPRSGTVVIEMENLSKKYDENLVLDRIDLVIQKGERIAFVGKNGEGKTTLSKIIVNELDHNGKYKIGHNVKIGYFAQNQDELLDENKTVFETIDQVAVGDIRTKIRGLLGAFLFQGEDIDKKVKVLSGGERSRLALIKLLLEPYNLLVLDEPTNHLDMRSKDILKHALIDYHGTLIVVSHDREFLNGIINKIYEFKNQKIKEFIGGIYDFLKKNRKELLLKTQAKKTNIHSVIIEKESPNKNEYFERKEKNKLLNKISKQIKECENRIEKIESEIEKINKKIAAPELYQQEIEDNNLYEKYQEYEKLLEYEMKNWEDLNNKLEKLNNLNN
ncbi:ABC-F family ATP-binding cassette domain-containing protein [Bacteroidota bacterium]